MTREELISTLTEIFGEPIKRPTYKGGPVWWYLDDFDVGLLSARIDSKPLFYEKFKNDEIELIDLLEKIPNHWKEKIIFNLDLFV